MSEQTEPCKDDDFIPMHQQHTLLKNYLITSFVANFFYSGKISDTIAIKSIRVIVNPNLNFHINCFQ